MMAAKLCFARNKMKKDCMLIPWFELGMNQWPFFACVEIALAIFHA
jgi:hypothetical protein